MPRKFSIPSANKKSSRASQQQQVFAEASDPLTRLQEIDIHNSNLDELAVVVREANQACEKALLTALHAAIIVGNALIVAKEKFFYDRSVGGFRGWIEEQELGSSTAYRYMELARYSEIVSQAGTLSEAHALIAKHKAERLPEAVDKSIEFKKLRTTLRLQPDRYKKLEAIATEKGIDYSDLISEVLDKWLSRQKIEQTIEVEAQDDD